jgi:septum site-determining protein MinD
LIIDADVGLRNLDILLGLENRIIYTGLDVLNETCQLKQALIQDKRQQNLYFFPLSSSQAKTTITAADVKSLINKLEESFDFILIDSPAGIDTGFLNATECASEAIVVVTPEVPSIRDADRVIGLLMVKNINKIHLVINRIRPNMVKNDDMMSIDDVKNILGIPLLGVIPDSEKIIIASNQGEPIVLDTKNSLPRTAFDNTTKRLLGEEITFLDLSTKTFTNPVKRILKNIITRTEKT